MQLELNDAFLRSLKPPARGRLELRDTLVNGLVLRMTPTGTASWSVRAVTRDGKHTRPGLGVWPRVGVKAARDAARVCLGEITAGRDPAAEKRSARADRKARAALPTVSARLTQWRGMRAAKWSSGYAREVERLCTKFIEPALGKRALAETMRSDWTDVISAQREARPTTATWLYQLSSAFLNYAEAHGWVSTSLLPRKGLTHIAPKVAQRERVLSDDELRRIWRASEALPAKPRCFVRLLVLTGCRVSEAGGIAVGELDLAGRRWAIPGERAKNRTPITLPLCALAMAELAAVMPATASDQGYRLLGGVAGGALQGYSSIKRRIDALSGVTDWVMHDLRRSMRTGLSRLGINREISEACLNHISGRSSLVGIYDRYTYVDEIIVAVERWQAFVAELVTDSSPGAELIQLRA